MKADIHPKYGPATIRCACGNVIETKSTRESIMVDICSACHPFFTGKQKLVDTAGRIDKFQKKFSGKVVTGAKKVKKSKKIVSFEPTVSAAPQKEQPARRPGPSRQAAAKADSPAAKDKDNVRTP